MNTTDLTPIPAGATLEQFKNQSKDLLSAVRAGDSEAIRRVSTYHPRSSQLIHSGVLEGRFTLVDAQLVIAREHGFASWPKFAKHIEALTRETSAVSKFESAADAIVTGDAAKLESLLRQNPELIQARSTRVHRAMLLHYIGANGFENFRQKTPKNAVEIAKILLNAGAEADAVADTYGKGTTLGLVATSVHPKRAGVQIVLLETLLDHGAAVDGIPGGWNPLVSALHNGRGEAAQFLARRGAQLDLEGAAGVGRLDVVESFFNEDGSLKANATKAQMELGFVWACEYGRNNVIKFLLRKGLDLSTQAGTGLTGLHWAVVGGQLDTIKLLQERGAPLEAMNVYGGTVLSQTLWCCINGDPEIDYVPIVETLLDAGAKIEEGSVAWLMQSGRRSSLARIAEVLRRRGANS